MPRWMVRLAAGAGFVVLAASIAGTGHAAPESASSADQPSAHTRPRDLARHAPYRAHQLIVKYRDSLTACAHCLLSSGASFRESTADHSDSLDQLMRRFHVQQAQPLFRSPAQEESLRLSAGHGAPLLSHQVLREAWRSRVEAAKSRNARRSAAVASAAVPDLSHAYVLTLSDDADVPAAAAAFAADPHVAYAHPNYLARATLIPNDTYYSRSGSWGQSYDDLWGLKKIGVEQAWDAEPSLGEGVVVAVVDTGVDARHPDLAANLVPGWDFTTCQVFGDFGCAQPKTRDSDPSDGHGHGTHVAGTIAAIGFNGRGVIGVAPRAHIMALKALNDQGAGVFSDLADAIEYAVSAGADVINNSWGCQDPCPEDGAPADAVRYALAMNRVVVFAAGNADDDVSRFSPQNLRDPKPIIVAATDHLDQRSTFSNFGELIDIAAPGGESGPACGDVLVHSILSLRAAGTDFFAECGASWVGRMVVGAQYYRSSGTSMAAPHVAGAAALVLAHRPTLKPEEVRQVLRAGATDVDVPGGLDVWTGTGRLNAAEALRVDSVLRVRLTSPASGATINRVQTPSVSIRGTAAGPDFHSYQLVMGSGLSPSTWTALGPPVTHQVTNGFLGTWSVAQLPPGLYWLKLVGTTNAGYRFEDATLVEVGRAHRLTATSSPRDHVVVSGALAAWQQLDGSLSLHDFTSGSQRRLTSDAAQATWPALSGRVVTWQDTRGWDETVLDPCLGIPSAIYQMNVDDAVEQQLSSLSPNTVAPSADGRLVVWMSGGSANPTLCGGRYSDIWYADTQTGVISMVPRGSGVLGDRAVPQVSGNRIVWMDARNGRWDIYLYDIAARTERRLTNNAADQMWPDISGTRVVWTDFRHADGDLYLYDLAANTERPLVTAAAMQAFARIDGDRIVWMDDRNRNWDIYLYDLKTRQEQPLTFHLSSQHSPEISGTRVVWLDDRHGIGAEQDIYALDVPALGDVNADGRITAADAQMALKMAVGTLLPERVVADANVDNSVSATDALCILKRAVGVLASLPCTTNPALSLEVKRAGTGAGSLVAPSSPTTIETFVTYPECQVGCGPMQLSVAETVRFGLPQAAYGSVFTSWSGACTGTSTCSVTVNAQKTVTANFAMIPNLLSNGGFENDKTTWSGWGTNKLLVTATTMEPAFEATRFAKVLLNSGTLIVTHTLMPVMAGTSYLAKAAIKTSATGTASVQLIWKTSGGRTLRTDTFGATTGTVNWTIKTSPLYTAPATAANLQVRLITTAGTGTASFDGVRVEQK